MGAALAQDLPRDPDTRAIDDSRQRTCLSGTHGNGFGDLIGVGDVGFNETGPLRRRSFQVRDHHVGASFKQRPGRCFAESRGSSGHDERAVFDVHGLS